MTQKEVKLFEAILAIAAPFIKLAEEYKEERNDITHYPVWFIAKKTKAGGVEYIQGIYFSRADAKQHLDANRHKYGKGSFVWCAPCDRSSEFRNAFDAALNYIGIDSSGRPIEK